MPPYLGDKTNPFTVFDYSPTLSFDRNKEFLKSFTGFVQADASNGFDALFKDGTKVEVGCSAHPRRKADEAKDAEPKDCEEILDIYTKLYKIEEKSRVKSLKFGCSRGKPNPSHSFSRCVRNFWFCRSLSIPLIPSESTWTTPSNTGLH